MNNVVLCFIVPPPLERPHSSWRAIVYTKNPPEKVYHGTRTYPTRIEPEQEVMKQEICDPDHIPAHIVQLTPNEQYVYIEGDVCEVLAVEVTLADGCQDPYLKRCTTEKKNTQNSHQQSSGLILPGQIQPSGSTLAPQITIANKHASLSGLASPPANLDDLYIVDITFKTHEVKDPDIVKRVKETAWTHGIM